MNAHISWMACGRPTRPSMKTTCQMYTASSIPPSCCSHLFRPAMRTGCETRKIVQQLCLFHISLFSYSFPSHLSIRCSYSQTYPLFGPHFSLLFFASSFALRTSQSSLEMRKRSFWQCGRPSRLAFSSTCVHGRLGAEEVASQVLDTDEVQANLFLGGAVFLMVHFGLYTLHLNVRS